jgi:glycerol-3-phosphate acyltransferase PlsY
MTEIAFAICGYLIGSLSFAVIVSRLFGLPDPRSYGSGNPGATNVLRTGRRAAAALTLIGDAGKGWFAVVLAQALQQHFSLNPGVIAVVALAAFVGHLWPLYFRFQGGKGVATAAGILLAINPWLGAGTIVTWVLIFFFFRFSSLAALIAALFAPFAYLLLIEVDLTAAAVIFIALLLIWRHRANIQRLLAGTEGRFGGGSGSPGAQ